MLKKFLGFLLLVITLSLACSKDNNPTGPSSSRAPEPPEPTPGFIISNLRYQTDVITHGWTKEGLPRYYFRVYNITVDYKHDWGYKSLDPNVVICDKDGNWAHGETGGGLNNPPEGLPPQGTITIEGRNILEENGTYTLKVWLEAWDRTPTNCTRVGYSNTLEDTITVTSLPQ